MYSSISIEEIVTLKVEEMFHHSDTYIYYSKSENSTQRINLQIDDSFEGLCFPKDPSIAPYPIHSFSQVVDSFLILINSAPKNFKVILTHDFSFNANGQGLKLKIEPTEEQIAFVSVQGEDLTETLQRAFSFFQLTSKKKFTKDIQGLGWEPVESQIDPPTHQKIIEAISSLRDVGCQPYYVLLHEEWKDSSRFPYGLKGLIKELQQSGVKEVGVTLSNSSRENFDWGRSFEKYSELFHLLADQGVSFVKLSNYSKNYPAILAASFLYFDSVPLGAHFFSSQVSMDVKRRRKAKQTLRKLLLNAIWIQQSGCQEDYSWFSDTPCSGLFALYFSLSGSLNVISDPPGKHQPALFRKMVLPSGRMMKPDRLLLPCEDSIFSSKGKPLNFFKAHTIKNKTGIVGVFNLHQEKKSVHGKVSPSDVEGLNPGEYVLFSHHKGFICKLLYHESVSFTLKPDECDSLIFSPVFNGVSVIGSYLFYLAPGPLMEISFDKDSVKLKSAVLAPLLLYSERDVLEVRRDGNVIPYEYDRNKSLLRIDERSNLIEVETGYSIFF